MTVSSTPVATETLLVGPEPPTADPKPHQCPYGGQRGFEERYDRTNNTVKTAAIWCGVDGWLCDRCKEDRADRRSHYREDVMEELARLHDAISQCEGRLTGLSTALASQATRLERVEADTARIEAAIRVWCETRIREVPT